MSLDMNELLSLAINLSRTLLLHPLGTDSENIGGILFNRQWLFMYCIALIMINFLSKSQRNMGNNRQIFKHLSLRMGETIYFFKIG